MEASKTLLGLAVMAGIGLLVIHQGCKPRWFNPEGYWSAQVEKLQNEIATNKWNIASTQIEMEQRVSDLPYRIRQAELDERFFGGEASTAESLVVDSVRTETQEDRAIIAEWEADVTRAEGALVRANLELSRLKSTPTQSPAAPAQPPFHSYDEATQYVRSHYARESIDTRRSSWITSAEYFYAGGRGYLILGMKGRPYLFAGVPREVWEGFKSAPSLGRYYHQRIRGRYRFNL